MIRIASILFFAGLTQSPADDTVKTYSLASLRLTAPTDKTVPYGGFLPRRDGELSSAAPFFATSEEAVPSLGDILDVLKAAAGADGDSMVMVVHGDRLLVQGSATQQACVAATLADLEAAVAVPVKVDVAVYLLPWIPAADEGSRSPSILTKDEVSSAEKAGLGVGQLLWESTLEGLPGRVFEGGPQRQVSFVSSFHCEVAKKAQIAEPELSRIATGIHIAAQAFPSSRSDSIYLCVCASYSDVLGMTQFATRASDVGTIDIPKVNGIRLASSAHVPAGGALAISARHPDLGRLRITFKPRWTGVVRRLGVEAGAKPVLFARTPFVLSSAGRQLPRLDEHLTPTPPESGASSTGTDFLKGSPPLSRLTRTQSGFIFASGDAEGLDALVRRLAQQEKDAASQTELDIRIVKAKDAAEAVSFSAVVQESAVLVAGLHASAGCVLAREETAVEGYQALVAEEAAIVAPDVKNLFRGFAARARALDIDKNRARVEIEILRCDFGPRERIVSDATDVGDLERVPRRRSEILRVVELSPGTTMLLGDLGVFGKEHLFAIAVGGAPAR